MSPTFTQDEARGILQSMRHAAGTIFRALDLDGDGTTTAADVANAQLACWPLTRCLAVMRLIYVAVSRGTPETD